MTTIDLIKPTLIFSIVGLFIPGFTAFVTIGMEMLLNSSGLDCITAWKTFIGISIILGLLQPVFFYLHIKKLTKDKFESIRMQLTYFNLFEYILIQASLTPLFVSGQTHCYRHDGQSGVELVLTAWLSLPILIFISYIFNETIKKRKFQNN